MKLFVLTVLTLFLWNCGTTADKNGNNKAAEQKSNQQTNAESSTASRIETPNAEPEKTAQTQTNQPKTVREFFNLLPPKYFALEGCEPQTDKNCDKARAEYVKTYLEIEDTKNGYWKSGCDGAQSCLTFALFKRPDQTYVVHVLTEFEGGEETHFLEYKNGNWTEISEKIIPDFSQNNIYVPPRIGTNVEVFKKESPEPSYTERGAKIYDLQWNGGKFSIKK
jgi:hypothetical protein